MGGFTSLMSSWTESPLVLGVSIVLLGCDISTSFGASLAFSLISLLLSESPFFILFLPEPNNPPTAPPTPSTTFPTLVTGLNGFALSFFSCFALSLDSKGATCTDVGSDGMTIVSVASDELSAAVECDSELDLVISRSCCSFSFFSLFSLLFFLPNGSTLPKASPTAPPTAPTAFIPAPPTFSTALPT